MTASSPVDIPADWLAGEPQLPDRCARHGLPAVRRVTIAVRSNPRLSSRGRAFLPGSTSMDRAAEYVGQVKIIKVAGWPLCARCLRRHTVGLALAGALFFGGLIAMIAGFAVAATDDGPSKTPLLPILLGFAALLVSPVPLRAASLPRVTGAEAAADGSAVHVAEAHPDFVRRLPHVG